MFRLIYFPCRSLIAALPFLAAFVVAGVNSADAQQSAWTGTANAEVRYFNSRDSLGNRATQVFTPFGVQLSGKPNDDWKVNFLMRSGYLSSETVSQAIGNSASAFTDTNVTPTVTYLGFNGFSPYVSLPINLPTAGGSASAPLTLSRTRADSDIIPTPTFGEGFNIGPTIGTNINISESMVLGIGAGYTDRGAFDQGTAIGVSRFNPGDVTTINSTFGYRGDALSVQATLSWSTETTTLQDGIPLYRAGDRIIAGIKAGYALSENWAVRTGFNFSHFEKNDVQPAANVPVLVREIFNSNSNVTQANAELSYSADRFSIGPAVTFLHRDRNSYNPKTFQFLPAKTSVGAGLNGSYQFTPAFVMTASVQHIWVRENESPAKLDAFNAVIPGSGVPQASSNVWTASIGGKFSF